MIKFRYILLLTVLCLLFTAVLGQNRQAPKWGVARGVVTDGNTKRAVAGAAVAVTGDTVVVLTNERGEFSIAHVKPGYNILYVTADGYHAMLTESFLVTVSSPSVVDISLMANDVSLGEVVVSASAFVATTESPVSMRRIGIEEIEMTPGANRDISKVVQSAPGVVATSAHRNDILVRGGGANENRYYLDGIEIPVLNHFAVQGGSGGNASLVNTDFLQSVNFYTGAFPSNLGSGLSSVLDMRMKNGNSERFKGKLTLGASDVGVSVDTPISKNGKTTLLASYRRSYLQMLFSVLELPFLPTYNDFQAKITSRLSPGDELYFIGLGSIDDNRLNFSIDEPDPDQSYILGYLPENRQSSYVAGVGYRHSFSGGQLRIIASNNGFYNHLYKYTNNDNALPKTLDYDTHQTDTRLRAELELWSVGGFRFTGGVGGGMSSYRNTTSRAVFEQTASRTEQFESSMSMFRYELFATASRRFINDRLALLVGLRMDGATFSGYTSNPLHQLSPRVSLSYDISEKWGVNASVARYYQEPPYTTMSYRDSLGVAVNKLGGLRYMAVNHYIAGVEFLPSSQTRLSLEGFYKAYSDFPVSLRDSLPLSTGDMEDYSVGDVPVRSLGRGRAYGAEFSYRNMDMKNTVLNLSYTFFYSQFNRPDKSLRPSSELISTGWDVGHILNLSAIHKFSSNWTLGAKWYLIGGFPYSPYDFELSSRIDAWDARRRPYADFSRYNSERQKPYHQLDVRLDKVWYFNKWRLGFYVDIQNLYNFSSEGQAIYAPETDVSGAYVPDLSKPGHYKMQSIKNSVGGTILPTLGITIEM